MNALGNFVGKPVRKKPLRRKYMWEDNIKMDLSEVGWAGIPWIDLSQIRDQWRAVVNTVTKF
jgi:hypothetical protein